jgi:DNA-binding NarL/FixJ family response regulator
MAAAPDRFHAGEIRVLAARLLRPSPVRVLIADDDDLFAEALALVLAREERIEIVAITRNGREALERAMWSRPDVVLMDLHMPVMDGVEATRRIGAAAPGCGVVFLTASTAPEDEPRALEAGALRYVHKGGDPSEIVDAVLSAASRVLPLRPRERSSR